MTSKEAFYKFICNVDSNKPTIIISLQDAGVIKELVDRDTPKKVEIGTSKNFKFPICPNCKVELNEYYKYDNKFCKECGQRLDWSE